MCELLAYCFVLNIFIVKQKTAYEMRISDWSSDVCSSDLPFLNTDQAAAYLKMSSRLLKRLRREARARSSAATVAMFNTTSTTSTPGRTSIEIGRASCRERVCQYV